MTNQNSIPRRQFLGNLTAAGSAALLASAAIPLAGSKAAEEPSRKIKLGVVGLGGRGAWIAGQFQKHGGYDMHAVADYFPDVAEAAGNTLGVDKSRRFSGLSGYKKLLDSGVEAVAIEDVPYFYPEQATVAVQAGCHVYIAKPVAVDVPGCLAIGAAGRLATEKKQCFLVDYQLPTEPPVIEIAQRVRNGAIGELAHILSIGFGWQGWPDPPLGPTIENRLRDEMWLSDTALSGDTLVSYDIHIIDGIVWLLGQRPSSACGVSRTCRPQPHGDRTDCAGVIYQFDNGLLWTHSTQAITNDFEVTTLSASILGMQATAHLQYSGKVYIRGGESHYVGTCDQIYEQGAVRNIAEFHDNITQARHDNPTVQRAVDSTLTAILGREAAARRCFLTMDELIKENKRLEVSLQGLQV